MKIRDQRDEALRFLVHFLGDIHMPFHTTGKDIGGNKGTWIDLLECSELILVLIVLVKFEGNDTSTFNQSNLGIYL